MLGDGRASGLPCEALKYMMTMHHLHARSFSPWLTLFGHRRAGVRNEADEVGWLSHLGLAKHGGGNNKLAM